MLATCRCRYALRRWPRAWASIIQLGCDPAAAYRRQRKEATRGKGEAAAAFALARISENTIRRPIARSRLEQFLPG
jgi:hypothetical protein